LEKDYILTVQDKEDGKVYRSCGWDSSNRTFGVLTSTAYNERLRNISIDYTAGYCTPEQETAEECTRTLPYDIEGAIIAMVSRAYKIYCTQTQGQASYKAGSVSIVWKDILGEQSDVVDFYKRRFV
jgi:hypothetical protein